VLIAGFFLYGDAFFSFPGALLCDAKEEEKCEKEIFHPNIANTDLFV